jgi:outer membrane protein OmpA-like peptidoglycan-associated protein
MYPTGTVRDLVAMLHVLALAGLVGCGAAKPPLADPDGDGMTGSADRCPRDPEQHNGIDDDDGCPDRARDPVCTALPFPILDVVTFGASDDVRSALILDALAATLVGNPELELLEIRGHTSDSDPSSEEISLERARAIVEQLASRGIDRSRLLPRGLANRCKVVDRVDFRPARFSGVPVGSGSECDRYDGEAAGRPPPC